MPEKQESAFFVFGYGSMINPDSIRKSLPHITNESLRVALLDGFERSWTALFDVDTIETSPPRVVRVAFLNVTPMPQKKNNGVLIPVTAEELAMLDRREKTYDRLDVTQNIKPSPPGRVYVYSQPQGAMAADNVMVPARYIRILDDGCAHWGAAFTEEFRKTTVPHGYPVMEGEYRFRDEDQNKAAGRDKP